MQPLISPTLQRLAAINGDRFCLYPDGSALLLTADGKELAGTIASYYLVARDSARQIFYPTFAKGEELLRATYLLQQGHVQSPGPQLLKVIADPAVFEHFPAGSIPLGVGGSRLAFLRPDGTVVVIGRRQRIRANPYSLFPKSRQLYRGVDESIEVRICSFADVTSVTFEDADRLRLLSRNAGWDLNDAKVENLGRLPDGSVRIVDTDASVELGDKDRAALDPATAIPAYQRALLEVEADLGADNELAGDLHLGLALQFEHEGDWHSARRHRARAQSIAATGDAPPVV